MKFIAPREDPQAVAVGPLLLDSSSGVWS